jgi:TonB family protein
MPQRHRGAEMRKERETRRQEDRERRRSSPCLLVSIFFFLSLCGPAAASIQNESFEKRAISSAQEMSASEFDKALPKRHFAGWFNEVVGPNAGVVWQMAECGEPIGIPGEPGYDLPACAEINATLPDGRKVFVAISVGTFKKGQIGKPTFFRAVIEQNERFHQVSRLSELPEKLRSPAILSAAGRKNRIAVLPLTKMDSGLVIAPLRYLEPLFRGVPTMTGDSSREEKPPPAPLAPPPSSTQDIERIPESVSQSRAVTKVKPDYPPTAKKMNATGPVKVEIIISEAGLVVEATAISGHLALRSAAVEAARKWVFEPAIANGAPVRVKSVLTFLFAPSAK